MSHPTELLLDYALAELEPNKARELEVHLRQCGNCRSELKALQAGFIALSESLPAATAPAESWAIIQQRIKPQISNPNANEEKILKLPLKSRRNWQAFALAASFILAIGGFFWGYQTQRNYEQISAEQRKVAGWLSRPDVASVQFVSDQGDRLGSVLTLSDGRALFVLRDPPAKGLVYQAWGIVNDERISLGVSTRTLLEVPYTGYEFIGTSLEPEGGSQVPTTPLGRVAVPLEPVPENNDYSPEEQNSSTSYDSTEERAYEHNYDTPVPDISNETDYGN